jgi:hypothetical protein
MEGCLTMGLGYALAEEERFDNGRLLDTNYDTYAIPRFSWVPKIETVIVPNPSLPPKGGGEPAIVCMGGVLATAVHDATGAKVLQLPMTRSRVMGSFEKQVMFLLIGKRSVSVSPAGVWRASIGHKAHAAPPAGKGAKAAVTKASAHRPHIASTAFGPRFHHPGCF